MDKKRFLSLLVLLVLFGGGLLYLWGSLGGTAPASATTEVADSTRVEGTPQRDGAPLEAPDAAEIEHGRKATDSVAATDASSRTENFALEGAQWIEGSVRIPSGAPSDETLAVWVVAWSEAGRNSRLDLLDLGSMIATLRNDVGGTRWSRRTVDSRGQFKAPLPADESRAALFVDGRFLYLTEPRSVPKEDLEKPITLEPELGACLAIRCVPPAGAGPEDSAFGANTSLTGFSMRPQGPRSRANSYVSRKVTIGADSTVELRALPPDLRYTLTVSPKRLAIATKSELGLAAGKKTDLVLDLKFGARVSGRILDEQGAPVGGAKVSSSARNVEMFGRGRPDDRSVESGADGKYEIAGLRPGKQRLSVALENWADGQSDELALKDEQRLTGVDIVLPHGATISGRITWPDGQPAMEAGVQAFEAAEKRARFGAGNKKIRGAKADASGKFTIRGLEKGPFLVSANSRKLELAASEVKSAASKGSDSVESGAGKAHETSAGESATADEASDGESTTHASSTTPAKKAILWIASQADVKPGTTDLVLVLHAPAGLTGRVVDESGAPLHEFTVEVNPDWQSSRVSTDRGMHQQSFKCDDGSFRVDDVNDGDWKVTVKSPGYSQSGAAVGVEVPQSGDPLVVKMVVAATIAGSVVDPSGKPVKDAQVAIKAQGETNRFQFSEGGDTNCDDKGAFLIKNVAAGAWQITASAEGWAKSEPLPVPVAPGENVANVTLSLRAGGSIVGEVWDARGAHAAGRHVQMFSMSAGDFKQATVDESGSFKADHISPGAFQVMLEPSEADQAALSEGSGNGDQPDIADMFAKMKMTSCEVKDGEVTHVVLGAPPKAPVKLSGRITQGGEPVTKVTLVVLNEGGALLQSLKFGKVDANGHYELTIDKPGDVVLVVTKEFGRAKGVDFYLTVPEVPEFTADLALPMSAIRGNVRGPDGAPLAKFPVQLMRDASGANIMMMDGPPSESTDENGRYEFKDLNAGTYAVAAGGTAGPFGNEDTSFGRVVHGGLRIEKDRVLEGIDLKLGAPAKISGTVRDASGNPVSGATVYVRDAQGELLSRFSSCASDASGKFVYKGVSPGSYTLNARTKTLAAHDGPVLRVHEGENTEMDIALEAGTMLRVSAVDKDEKPVKASISVRDEHGLEVGNMTSTDAMQDAFTQGVSSTESKIGPLPSGKYVVTATAPDGKSAKKAVTLKGQDERKLVVRID